MRIVVDDAIAAAELAFGSLGELTCMPGRAIVPGAAPLREAEALIVRSITAVDAGLLASMPKLRFVGTATAGRDHLDERALAERGIAVADAAGCNAQAVAEWVVVALLSVLPRLPDAIARGPLGIVGVGQVGSRLAALVRSLGLVDELLCCDPPRARRGDLDEAWLSLDELWARSTIVSLHVPLVREGADRTLALIDVARPRPTGAKLLVNTCRGAVVPDRALARPDIHARVLDVYEHEPELDAATLLDPRTLLRSPHVAGYSLEAKLRASAMMHAALSAWLGRSPSVDLLASLPRAHVPAELPPLSRLHHIVDLPGDDARVRALFELPARERPAAFEALRRTYALRRELSSCDVEGGEPLLAPFRRRR